MSEEKKDCADTVETAVGYNFKIVIYRQLALNKLCAHIGEQETPPGSNKGPVVDWAVTPWAGKSHGAMPWCAGAVSTAYLEAGYPAMNKIGSLSCDTLYRNVCSLPDVKILKAPLFFKSVRKSSENYLKQKKKEIHVVGCPSSSLDDGACTCEKDGIDFDFEYLKQNAGFLPSNGDMIFFGEEHNLHHVGLVFQRAYHFETKELLVKTVEGNHENGVHLTARKNFFAIVRLP